MIPVGTLNRVRASIKFTDHAELNVSASYLAKEGIELTFQGNMTDFLPAMTGAVQSPQPYMIMQAKVHLLRSQSLGSQYKTQWEANSAIGDAQVYSDSKVFGDFQLLNTAITSVADMSFAGGEPGVALTITGTYYINSEMWDL
ncbi:hypothetical protein BL250_16630 [Erwinia sp. OLTSP20]|uniref:hypothetical protein n=1 Tax=Enterobacterales TaxID=91347 RepID=UPI000C19C974|nr:MULTISPECIES: hypothetical protein [Enterobacterales]PIJ48961.1 hypothetical protein BV501_14705 [Erwinia sp. OAMSP11]PIJ74615.1 hypothetical protein BK416_03910 [Erwinia sp. OLSSP12]PIJ79646.1 hypothetical protein BLD47_13330 [Erwinia sp. OLCASP19]PIJ80431.1 hypothetical protein BLD46_15175 [Erwinia sp. OLMTSP26]PIJ82546.1 hypothetical protein BLD49_15070 [Erwinia sp. OLMDSP33]